jgi:hypothetical protein
MIRERSIAWLLHAALAAVLLGPSELIENFAGWAEEHWNEKEECSGSSPRKMRSKSLEAHAKPSRMVDRL